MSVNKYNGTDLIKIAGKGQKGDLIEDTKDCMTTFISSDDSTESGLILPSGGDITVPQIVSGNTHSNLFSGLSKIALNTRKLINTAKRIWNSVGATWVSGHAYAVNDMVVYENGHVYKCKAAHTSSSSILPTNTTYWTDTTLAAEICSLNNSYKNVSTWTRVSHTSSGQYRGIKIPNGKKVIDCKIWDRGVFTSWDFYNHYLYYVMYTTYNGNIVAVTSQQTVSVDYIMVDD